jgi:hypothetical protein
MDGRPCCESRARGPAVRGRTGLGVCRDLPGRRSGRWDLMLSNGAAAGNSSRAGSHGSVADCRFRQLGARPSASSSAAIYGFRAPASCVADPQGGVTTSGTPSRAISTAWACRSWCGAKRRRTPALAAVRRRSARAAALAQCRPRVAPLTMQTSGPTGSSRRASSHGWSCCQPHASMPTSRRHPPLPWRTSSDPRHWSRSASPNKSAAWIRRPARQRITTSPHRRCPCGPSPAAHITATISSTFGGSAGSKPGSTDSRGESTPYARPSADPPSTQVTRHVDARPIDA